MRPFRLLGSAAAASAVTLLTAAPAGAASMAPAGAASIPSYPLVACYAAAFQACNENGYILYNNPWNTAEASRGDGLWANSVSDWGVQSDQGNANTGSVKTFVSAQQDFNLVPVSSLTHLYSSFTEQMPPASQTYDAEAAYDLFFNNYSGLEVMTWVDNHRQTPAGSVIAHPVIYGQHFTLWRSGSTFSFVLDHNEQSGTVHLLAELHYLVRHGLISASDGLSQTNFGWEICSTTGRMNFSVSRYSQSVG
jgi:hypothetical protein